MDLLERESHLLALDGWFREAAAGQGRLVLVGGEAGVGKSTLVSHACQTVAAPLRARVLIGACDALSTPRPLGPVQDIALQTGGALDRLLTEQAPRDRLFQTVLAELGSGPMPTLAVIEDAHWADEATLDLLRFLGRRLETVRALLIVTYRDDEVGPAHPLRQLLGDLATTNTVRRLNLAPLTEAGIATLAAKSAIDPVALHHLTGGNPFFATEILAGEGAAVGGIPATVRDAVLARASRLTLAARAALDAAAAIGSPIAADLLGHVAAPTVETIDECLTAGMLVDLDRHTLAFRHELARMAIYDTLAPLRRRNLHARILDSLQLVSGMEQDLARLAHHAEAAEDAAAVLRFAPAAGQRAARLHAHREAAAQYRRALRFAQTLSPTERAEMLEAASYECYLTGQSAEAVALRREALPIWRASGDRVREGEALRWVSRFAWMAGQTGEATMAADEALAVLASLPPGRELAMARSNRSQLYMLAGETASAVSWGEQAIALAEALDETEILVHALNNVGTARLRAGDARGREDLERSLALARTADLEEHVARALTNLSWFAVHAHDLPHAESYLADGITYTTDHDLDSWRHYLLGCRSQLRLLSGNWEAASDDAAAVLRMPHVSPISRIAALATRGLVRARRGDPGVWEVLDEALALAEPTGELQRLGPVRTARAEAAWLAGNDERAVDEVRAIRELARDRGSPWDRGEIALWLARLGHESGRSEPSDPESLPAPYDLALHGDWAGSASAWEALGCSYEAALVLLDGDEAALRRALASFTHLGARPAAAIATRRLREQGVRAIPRGPHGSTRANPAQLTGRELEILPLLAAGCRDAEIAQQLYLSPKTVGHHVGHILAKLGVHARSEVGPAAARLGLPFTPPEN